MIWNQFISFVLGTVMNWSIHLCLFSPTRYLVRCMWDLNLFWCHVSIQRICINGKYVSIPRGWEVSDGASLTHVINWLPQRQYGWGRGSDGRSKLINYKKTIKSKFWWHFPLYHFPPVGCICSGVNDDLHTWSSSAALRLTQRTSGSHHLSHQCTQ